MDRFVYQAYTNKGEIVSGAIEAPSHGEALQRLRSQGLIPFSSSSEASAAKGSRSAAKQGDGRRPYSATSRLAFVYELGILLRAQMPLDQALSLLPQQPDLRRVVPAIHSIADTIRAGKSLGQALSAHPQFLHLHETAMIRAAEQTGSVAEILLQLASSIRRQMELRSRVKAALTYPAILLCMSLLTVALVAAVLVPNLLPLFDGAQVEPPFVIRLFIALNSNLATIAVLLVLVALCAAGIAKALGSNEVFLLSRDRALLKLPVIGSLAMQAETVRVANSLGLLLGSGIALTQVLAIAQKTTKNRAVALAMAGAAEKVAAGTRVARAFAECLVMPPSACHLIAVGEEANRLDEMMLHIAEMTETAMQNRLERLMNLLTPTLTLLMGLLVGELITAVMNAILSVNEMVLP